MANRSDFARHLAGLNLSHVDRAVAFLWYYRETQEYDERTASDLAGDLYDEKFPRPNVTRLRRDLQHSRFTIKGRRNGSFQIDARRLAELDTKYKEALGVQKVHVRGDVIPTEWVSGTRKYLEQLVYQINGAYESGFFDCCSVLLRRLMESLIIEAYVHEGRQRDIQNSGSFLRLDQLITRITTDKVLVLNRNSPKIMQDVKQLGDTAAHDRTYITPKIDVDDLALRYRRMIQELLRLAGIVK